MGEARRGRRRTASKATEADHRAPHRRRQADHRATQNNSRPVDHSPAGLVEALESRWASTNEDELCDTRAAV